MELEKTKIITNEGKGCMINAQQFMSQLTKMRDIKEQVRNIYLSEGREKIVITTNAQAKQPLHRIKEANNNTLLIDAKEVAEILGMNKLQRISMGKETEPGRIEHAEYIDMIGQTEQFCFILYEELDQSFLTTIYREVKE